jgi:Protein of unknown function (DUF3179)
MERQAGFRWWTVALVLGVGLLAAAAFRLGRDPDPGDPTANDRWATKQIRVPAVAVSHAVPASGARLRPNAKVIGVSIGDWHRAYPTDQLSKSRSHVINDFLDGRAFSVAYCDRTDCARLFTATGRTGPLDIAVGGWFNEDGVSDMLVRVGPNRYRLKSGVPLDPAAPSFPYESVEIVTTTWHEWRTAHPTTDVFVDALPVELLN